MNWKIFRIFPFLDTRAKFIHQLPPDAKLLDIGSSDGQTLNHIHEMRPDIKIYAADIEGTPEKYPVGTFFIRCDIVKDQLPLELNSIDAITVMHVVEHLDNLDNLFLEVRRLLKINGVVYFETPRPHTLILDSPYKKFAGSFTLNFYDDPTPKKLITIGVLAFYSKKNCLNILSCGVSRNWLFAIFYLFAHFCPPSRKKLISYVHFKGWSSYLICRK